MAADTSTRNAIDDVLYDGVSDFDDAFNDSLPLQDQRDDKPTLSPRAAKRKAGEDGDTFGLGLDEEVKIAKKRAPIAKLDEARLLSEPGIPKLRALVRSRQISRKLRLKGKGHEFNDAAKLLNYFQLWLDDLYPRAKFADALSMAEKAGHTKRMQMTRCEWINEGKPGYMATILDESDRARDPDLFETNVAQSGGADHRTENAVSSDMVSATHDDSLFIPDANHTIGDDRYPDPDDDELEALLAEENEVSASKQPMRPVSRHDDSEGEDDLDALLAEQDARNSKPSMNTSMDERIDKQPEEEEYDDDLDALLAEYKTEQRPNNSEQIEEEDTGHAEASISYGPDHDDILPLPDAPAKIGQELKQDTNHAKPSPEELVEEDFLSSSPLPNDDIVEDSMPKDILTEQETEHSTSNHGRATEISANTSAVNHSGLAGHGELEEDFLSSSPIDLS